MSYQTTKTHGGTLNAFCSVKEANLKRLHTVIPTSSKINAKHHFASPHLEVIFNHVRRSLGISSPELTQPIGSFGESIYL